MSFRKGHSKKGGRQKGTPNQINKPIKELISNFCSDNWNKFLSETNNLTGIEYTKTYLSLLEYSLPKLARAEIITEESFLENRERLTIEERRFLIDKLREEMTEGNNVRLHEEF
jgi:hypothetical protein